MKPAIRAIEYYLPDHVLNNEHLAVAFSEWTADKIEKKTGIAQRHIAGDDQCSSDLGVFAAEKLFSTGVCRPNEVDFLLFCTQSPDYFLPTTACLVQERLRLPTSIGALDFNLGCSGFVYGLGLAKGLIESGQANSVLLIMAETYSKFMHERDKSVRTIFGDAGAATLVQGVVENGDAGEPWIGPLIFGTDGKGAANLIVPSGGMRSRQPKEDESAWIDEEGVVRSSKHLYMNGPEIFTFTLRVVPQAVKDILDRAHLTLDDVDLCIFHQANRYILDYLRKKLKVPEAKFYVAIRNCGNTVSSTIPIALKHAELEGRLKAGHRVLLVGFGVGYSWGAALIRWYGV
jgi:3-oxoacyl-[acyl-carrier-protein] synthase III